MLNFILSLSPSAVVATVETTRVTRAMLLPLLETIFLSFVEQIGLGTAQIDNLWAAIPLQLTKTNYYPIEFRSRRWKSVGIAYIFLLDGALFAIVRVRYAWPTANNASPLI